MASPSEASLNAQWQNAVALLENHLQNQTIVADLDTYIQSLESDFASEQAQGAEAVQAQAAAAIETGRGMIGPILTAFCHHIVGVPERRPQACIDRIYTFFNDNSKSVLSRNPTYGAVAAAGGNTGNGTVRRLSIDENGFEIENAHADLKTLKCVASQATGADKHEELFEIRGANAGKTFLNLKTTSGAGSGLVQRGGPWRGATSRDSLIRNAGFSQFSWTTPPAAGAPQAGVSGDSLTSWTVDDITNITLDVDTVYKDPKGSTATKAVLTDNVLLTQTFDEANIRLNPNLPYWYELAYRRKNSCDGTLRIDVGSQNVSVALTSATNDVWTLLTPALDQNLWPANFDENNPDFRIQMTGRTVGEVEIAQFVFVPMTAFDGLFYQIMGGETPFALDDEFTFTDSIPADSKIQKWLWLLFGRYLPHSGTPTLTDPA